MYQKSLLVILIVVLGITGFTGAATITYSGSDITEDVFTDTRFLSLSIDASNSSGGFFIRSNAVATNYGYIQFDLSGTQFTDTNQITSAKLRLYQEQSTFNITSWDIIVETIRIVLEQTPPELAADLVDKGIVLTGGGALLKNMDKLLQNRLMIPITIAEDPLTTVAIGSGMALANLPILKVLADRM